MIWDDLLKEHVSKDGMVDYKGFLKDRDILEKYLGILSANPPQSGWSEADELAFWINVYNAFTVKLIIDNYPLESIKDIGSKIQIPFVNTPWDIKFVKIGDATYDLNNVEHSILRKKFVEPRIHFAINCASFSCPELRAEAYTGAKLEKQLTEQAKIFLSDKRKNIIANDKEVQLSKIFSWFRGDFKKGEDGDFILFINQYSPIPLKKSTKISYMDYDWRLNDVK